MCAQCILFQLITTTPMRYSLAGYIPFSACARRPAYSITKHTDVVQQNFGAVQFHISIIRARRQPELAHRIDYQTKRITTYQLCDQHVHLRQRQWQLQHVKQGDDTRKCQKSK